MAYFRGAARYLQEDGRFGFDACPDDRLQLLEVVEVECRNGITAFDGIPEEFFGIDQPKFFVVRHCPLYFQYVEDSLQDI